MEEKITNGWLSNDDVLELFARTDTQIERSATTMSTNLLKESAWLSQKIKELAGSIRNYMELNHKDLEWEDCEFIATYLIHSDQIIETLNRYASVPVERS